MGIRFSCPNGHKLNVKAFLAGKRAICPDCGVRVVVPEVPSQSLAPSFADSPVLAAVRKPAAHEFVEADASSIALAIEDEELSLAPPIEPAVVAAPADLPYSIIAATTPSVVTPTPVTGTPDSAYDRQRERTRRNQMLMALALLFVVVVLAGILFWVLKRSAAPPSESAPEKTTSSLLSPTHVLTRAKV